MRITLLAGATADKWPAFCRKAVDPVCAVAALALAETIYNCLNSLPEFDADRIFFTLCITARGLQLCHNRFFRDPDAGHAACRADCALGETAALCFEEHIAYAAKSICFLEFGQG